MGDLFRMFRTSKIQFLNKQQKQQIIDSKSQIFIQQNSKYDNNNLNKNNHCIHVSLEKWEEIWSTTLKERIKNLEGIVFVNPNFARLYYIPSISFQYEFDDYNEYPSSNLQIMIHKGIDYHDKWMKTMIQATSCFISLHCCNISEIIDHYCICCPNLFRISLHYYYFDDDAINFIVKYLPQIISLNFENSIGLNITSIKNLGLMTKLLHLNLSGCDINEQTLNSILDNCKNLHSLNISNNCLITGHCLKHKTIKNLKRINLKDCWRITSDCLIEMARYGLPNLIELLCNSGINDQSLIVITSMCPNLNHLDISFEEFTYYDESGLNCLSDIGFSSISRLIHLRILSLRHVGRINDNSLNEIICSCNELMQIILNLRHRHKLTDEYALRNIGNNCKYLVYFEAVHNHFIGKNSLEYLSTLSSLQILILRGNEFINDIEAATLLKRCHNLRFINLDGCIKISENTLALCIVHARKLLQIQNDNDNDRQSIFQASLIMTSVERSLLNSFIHEFPINLRIRACDHQRNKVHFNEFDGQEIFEYQLKERFFPFYWHDFN